MMRRLATAAVLAAALLLPGPRGAAALAITDVVAERHAFDPSRRQSAEWRYHLSAPARVRASIFDARDLLVRVVADASLGTGSHRVTWDGRDAGGRPVPPGYYLLVLEAEAGAARAVYDPSDRTGGELTAGTVVGYDPASGILRYATIKPALLRIHAGLKGEGLLLRTVADWIAVAPGEHEARWDGWDNSRVVRFGASPQLDVQVWAYELPVNAVVVEGQSWPEAGAKPARMEFAQLPSDAARRARAPAGRHEVYNHWRHDRVLCGDPRASLAVAASVGRNDAGAVVVEGPVTVRLEMPSADAARIREERFEVVVYIDGAFVFEEEQGYLPFAWTLRPEKTAVGEHVLTYMIRGYEGHFGSASIRFVRPQAKRSDPPARR